MQNTGKQFKTLTISTILERVERQKFPHSDGENANEFTCFRGLAGLIMPMCANT